MKIRILSKCRAGGQHLPAGAVVDLPAHIARDLFNAHRAVPAPAEIEPPAPVEPAPPAPAPVVQPDAAPVTADTAPESAPADRPVRRRK